MQIKEAVENFYLSFKNRDSKTMGSHYHSKVIFNDPIFKNLDHSGVTKMWTMLCTRGKDLKLDLKSTSYNDNVATAVWEAKYTFSKTGRPVINLVTSTLEFHDGKIIKQDDDFDLYKWSKMALGISGTLFGWTSWFQKKLQEKSQATLKAYEPK